MQETVEHLKLIQGVMNRVAKISLILKGWTVTIVIAGLGIAVNASNSGVSLLTLLPSFLFWDLTPTTSGKNDCTAACMKSFALTQTEQRHCPFPWTPPPVRVR